MNILDFCDNGDILSIFRIIKIVILIIKIAVPIILIVTIMIDFMKCIQVGDDAELEKTFITSMKKFIAAALIFLIPTFVNLVLEIAGSNNDSISECFGNATTEKITLSYENKAKELVDIASKNIEMADYYSALAAVNKIKDDKSRETLMEQLDAVKKKMDKKYESIGSGTDNSSGSGDYIVSYDSKTKTFTKPSKRATSDSQTVPGTGKYQLNAEFWSRLNNFINAAASAGHTITVSSSYRNYSTQYSLYLQYCGTGRAACPGGSNHNWGLAADLAFDGTSCSKDNWDCNSGAIWAHDNASKFGLTFPLVSGYTSYPEPWHVEPTGIKSVTYGVCTVSC